MFSSPGQRPPADAFQLARHRANARLPPPAASCRAGLVPVAGARHLLRLRPGALRARHLPALRRGAVRQRAALPGRRPAGEAARLLTWVVAGRLGCGSRARLPLAGVARQPCCPFRRVCLRARGCATRTRGRAAAAARTPSCSPSSRACWSCARTGEVGVGAVLQAGAARSSKASLPCTPRAPTPAHAPAPCRRSATFLPSPYVDAHGEEDPRLQRGK